MGRKRKKKWIIICPAHKVYYAEEPKITEKSVVFKRPLEKPKKRKRKG